MADLDFFTTDFSILGTVTEAPSKSGSTSVSKGKRKSRTIAGITYEITQRPSNLGVPHTAEARAKMSATVSAYYANNPGSMSGRRHTAETRAQMSKSAQGRRHTAEARAKISQAGLGREVSAETRAKLAAVSSRTKSKPIQTPGGVYASLRQAAQAYSVTEQTMIRWKANRPLEFYFITKESL